MPFSSVVTRVDGALSGFDDEGRGVPGKACDSAGKRAEYVPGSSAGLLFA